MTTNFLNKHDILTEEVSSALESVFAETLITRIKDYYNSEYCSESFEQELEIQEVNSGIRTIEFNNGSDTDLPIKFKIEFENYQLWLRIRMEAIYYQSEAESNFFPIKDAYYKIENLAIAIETIMMQIEHWQ